jgi:hypothetical protein
LQLEKNKITTAEAASFSLELAEYCFFKAPADFKKNVVKKAILKEKTDIVEMGIAMGVHDINERWLAAGSGYPKNPREIAAATGNLVMFKLFLEKGNDIQYSLSTTIHAAAINNQLHFLQWLHRNNMCEDRHSEHLFFDAARSGNLEIIKWAKDVAGFNFPDRLINHAAASGNVELIKYLRSKEIPWNENTFYYAASSRNIAMLQYLFENECPHDDPRVCINAIEINDHEKALEVLQWLHEHNVPWDESACITSARFGNLKALKFLRLNNCPWDQNCFFNAIRNRHVEVVNYCLENRCPGRNGDILCMDDCDHDRGLKMMKLLRKFSVPWHRNTCSAAASVGNFEALQWAVSKGCPWERQTCANYAARHGNIEVLKWMRSEGVVFEENICRYAAEEGHLETIKFLRSIGCPLDRRAFVNAKTSAIFEYCIENDVPFDDHLYERVIDILPDPIRILKLLQNSGYPSHPSACTQAAINGDLKLLRWLRFNGFPWNESVCNEAVRYDEFAILKYAHENGCPWNKETYAFCFSEDGLETEYDNIPTKNEIECSEEIFQYIEDNNCPKPDPNDWNIANAWNLA